MATPSPIRPTLVTPGGPNTGPSFSKSKPDVNKTNHLGFNMKPSINLSFVKTNVTAGAPQSASPGPAKEPSTPGAGFHSNEDIHAFAEHLRKQARNRAVERAMDAEQLESTLRHIPAADGSKAGAWLRARRVSRHAKKIAAAEQAIAKYATALYGQFQAEYESELNRVGKGRTKQTARTPFQF